MTVIPNTVVRLLADVPLNNQYEHQMTFNSEIEQSTYFTGKIFKEYTDFTYQRKDGGYIVVPSSFESINNCNYIMFRNADYSVKWFYAFITRKEYVNPNTCNVYYEIDVYQTWQFNIQFKPSYVVREHQNRWNVDGSPVINTVDEEINYGSDYNTVSIQKYIPYTDVYFLVIVSKEPLHTGTNPTITPVINAIPTPLNYYVHPIKLDGTVPQVFQTSAGFAFNISPVKDVLKGLYTIDNAINNIVSLYVTEYMGLDLTYENNVITLPDAYFEQVMVQDANGTFDTFYIKDINRYNQRFESFGNKYDGYEEVEESKLLMHPYTVLILDDFKGNRIELKNEYIDSNNLIVTVRGGLGTSSKVAYTVEQYNSPNISGSDLLELSLENSLINNNPNDIPIVTDMLAAYLQGNRNTLINQRNQMLYSGVSNTIGSAMNGIGSALSRNPVGVASSVGEMATGAMNSYFNIMGMVAKKKDIDNTPPSIAKQGSDTAFDFGNGYTGLRIIKKQIKPEYRKKLADFFKMYGYKINELKVPNLKTRQHYNYVQTIGANIVGNIPHDDLNKIKNMFNNGITLWHTSNVCDYSLTNSEV